MDERRAFTLATCAHQLHELRTVCRRTELAKCITPAPAGRLIQPASSAGAGCAGVDANGRRLRRSVRKFSSRLRRSHRCSLFGFERQGRCAGTQAAQPHPNRYAGQLCTHDWMYVSIGLKKSSIQLLADSQITRSLSQRIFTYRHRHFIAASPCKTGRSNKSCYAPISSPCSM